MYLKNFNNKKLDIYDNFSYVGRIIANKKAVMPSN
jgi:hypothetical protein